MKTIEEFISEINESEELQNEFKSAKENDTIAEFLNKHGCEATAEEYIAAAKEEGSISDDAAEAVAGGIQAGDIQRHVRSEFQDVIDQRRRENPKTLPSAGERCKNIL